MFDREKKKHQQEEYFNHDSIGRLLGDVDFRKMETP